MKKITIIFTCFMLFTLSGKTQFSTVESIRGYYTQINKGITEAIKTKTGEYCNELTLNTYKSSWPTVGNYQKKISIWYSGDPGSSEDNPLQLLDKVNTTIESASNKSTEEYLFADGELVFYCAFDFYKYNGLTQKDEHRVYFHKGKVLKYDLKAGGHNEYARSKEDVLDEALRYGKKMQELFLSSCDYIN